MEGTEITMIVTDDGTVKVAVVAGATFEQAKPKIEALMASLGLAGAPIVVDGEIEQHKHDQEKVGVGQRGHVHR